jgi:hypothetical protein
MVVTGLENAPCAGARHPQRKEQKMKAILEKKVGMVAAIVIAVACATALILANAAIVSNAMASVEGSTDPVTLVAQGTDASGAAVYVVPSDEAIEEAPEETADEEAVEEPAAEGDAAEETAVEGDAADETAVEGDAAEETAVEGDAADETAVEATTDQALVTYGPRIISTPGKGAKEIVVTERAGSTGGFAVEWSKEKDALVLTAYDENGNIVKIKYVDYNEETGRYEAHLEDIGG